MEKMKILVINLKDLRVIRVGQPLHINPSPPHIRKRRWYCVQSEFIVYTGFLNLMNLISMITQTQLLCYDDHGYRRTRLPALAHERKLPGNEHPTIIESMVSHIHKSARQVSMQLRQVKQLARNQAGKLAEP
ncbi:unnamed protein product [Brassica oleracea var. botrytis]